MAHIMVDLDTEIIKAINRVKRENKSHSVDLNWVIQDMADGRGIKFNKEELNRAIFGLIERKEIKIELDYLNSQGKCHIYVLCLSA